MLKKQLLMATSLILMAGSFSSGVLAMPKEDEGPKFLGGRSAYKRLAEPSDALQNQESLEAQKLQLRVVALDPNVPIEERFKAFKTFESLPQQGVRRGAYIFFPATLSIRVPSEFFTDLCIEAAKALPTAERNRLLQAYAQDQTIKTCKRLGVAMALPKGNPVREQVLKELGEQ